MEKSAIIDEGPRNTISAGRVLTVLAGAVATLAVALIILVGCGTWYIGHLQQTNAKQIDGATDMHSKQTDEYDISVNHNKTISQQTVVIDHEQETTFVIIRAPVTEHITHILTEDYARHLDVVYISEAHACYVSHMEDDHPSFQDDVETVKNYNGDDVANLKTTRWTVGNKLTNDSVIPEQMTSFCSLQNSHWLIEVDASDKVLDHMQQSPHMKANGEMVEAHCCGCCYCCSCRCRAIMW